ncbi:response regulator [Paraburkholderia strydomiana]|uniref:response regulator n=1 Tax=Paraburkholderia strydomiana TaxID=1245417 RepID=UPI0038B917A6
MLLVEDEVDLLQALKAVLVLDGHTVQTAQNGADALHNVSLNFPDIVVSDVVMPVMDGMRLVRAVRAVSLLAHIPVILTLCIETDEVFASLTAAGRAKGISSSHITSVCKGRRKQAGGLTWEYVLPDNGEVGTEEDCSPNMQEDMSVT